MKVLMKLFNCSLICFLLGGFACCEAQGMNSANAPTYQLQATWGIYRELVGICSSFGAPRVGHGIDGEYTIYGHGGALFLKSLLLFT